LARRRAAADSRLARVTATFALPAAVRDPAVPRGIAESGALAVAFSDVTFSYPDSERAALREFSLAVPAGQVAAIVGANGAGKSTLVKLLCRLYDPQSGRVALGGVDLRELAIGDLRARITVLFQQPVRYHETVAGNIALESESPIDSLDITVAATGTYSAFHSFLSGVESSLRQLDVVKVEVKDSPTGVYTYEMTVRLYWLH
jgi:ABC-type multidrug transport system fused ATPase/permease subunit